MLLWFLLYKAYLVLQSGISDNVTHRSFGFQTHICGVVFSMEHCVCDNVESGTRDQVIVMTPAGPTALHTSCHKGILHHRLAGHLHRGHSGDCDLH